jgi:predicted PurR-regulated permease PerM
VALFYETMSSFGANNFWSRLNNLVLVRFLLLVASGWTIVQLLAYFEPVIVIFTFATILAFLLSYPVQWLRRFFPHNVAVVIVFLISIILLGGLIITISLTVLSQAQQLINSLTVFFKFFTTFGRKNRIVSQSAKYSNRPQPVRRTVAK